MDTIFLADGTYSFNGDYLRFAVTGVTLRSASRNRKTAGNLHLKHDAITAINQGEPLPPGMPPNDIDGDLRAGPPDIGADELPIDLPFKNFLSYLGS
jgi:hypothetical protein